MKNTFAKMFTVCALAGVLGVAFTGCDDSSSASGDNGSGGNRGGIPDTVETFMELSDYDCGKSQKCVATYLTEYHNMAVCDGDNGWVIGTLIEKMDCDFSSSSVKSSDSKGNPSSAGTSTKSSNSNSSGNGTKSSNSSASKVNCSALLEGETGWNWDVSKECRFNPDIDYGSMTDERDGKVYRTVTIGDQVWMAENLNYADSVKTPSLKRRNWCYNNVAANCDVTGRLYTWAAAMDSVKTGCGYENCSPTLPAQGVCPPNWHLPTYAEWNVLFTAVGGQSTAGKVLKSQSGWYSNGNGTDAFGFSALPAGNRFADGQFNYGGRNVCFWCSTEYHTGDAYRMCLDYLNEKAGNPGNSYKGDGYSVRCVKDSD